MSKVTSLLPKVNVFGYPLVRQVVPYIGLWVILFVLLGVVDGMMNDFSTQAHLLIFLGATLAFGVLNWYVLHREFLIKGTDGFKTGMTLLVVLIGAFIFWVKKQPLDSVYWQLFIPALTFFAFPWLFALAFQAHLTIPAIAFAPIEVDSLQEYIGQPFVEDNSRGISWVFGDDFTKFSPDGQYAFRTYTPRDVKNQKVSDLFKALLAFHNFNISQHNPISFNDCGWVFYKKSALLFPKGSKALNPEKTVGQNRIAFQKLSKEQRASSESSGVHLPKDFRFTTIYIQRIYSQMEKENNLPI